MEEVCASDKQGCIWLSYCDLGERWNGEGESSRVKRKERCFLLETHVSKEGKERSEEKEKDGEGREEPEGGISNFCQL